MSASPISPAAARSRSASSPTRKSSRSTASRCSSWSPRCATPTARSSPARCATPGLTRTVAAGQTLSGVPDIGLLLVTTRDNRPVYVRDVASVVIGPSPQEHRVWNDAPGADGAWDRTPAVSLALAKRAGANAVVVAERPAGAARKRRRAGSSLTT